MEFAVRWNTPNDKGETRSEEWARFRQEAPEQPEIPHNVLHVWQWFFDLSSQRHSGPEALTWADFEAWARLTGEEPTQQEWRMLVAMDRAYLKAVRRELKEQQDKRLAEQKTKGRRK